MLPFFPLCNWIKLHSEKRDKKSPLIESTANMENNQPQKTFKNKETLIIEPEKNASRIESLEQEKADEEEEGKKDESSCSSEEDEEDDSESEGEAEDIEASQSVLGPYRMVQIEFEQLPGSSRTQLLSTVSDFIASLMPVESVDPASWRQGLRKTGIVLVPSKGEKSMEKDSKGTRLAYVAPTIPRRLASTSDIEEKENSFYPNPDYNYCWHCFLHIGGHTSLLLGMKSLNPKEKQDLDKQDSLEGQHSCLQWSDLKTVLTEDFVKPQVNGVTLTDLQEAEKTIGRSRSTRTREQENEEKEKEEKEKQDKEKQEEKKESETSREDDYKQKYSRTYDETYTRYRPVSTSSSTTPSSSLSTVSSSLYASSQLNRPNSLVGITSAYSRGLTKESEREGEKKEEEKEGEDKSQAKSIRERRRPREKRRSTGVSFWTQDSDENEQERQSDTEDGSNKKETQTDSVSRYDSSSTSSSDRYDSLLGRSSSYSYLEERKPYSSRLEKDDSTDFKKLYEQILAENEKLKAQLHDTNMELTDLKLQLEKAAQRQERFADRSLLEMEKRERRALERRISEMEEELKMLPDLKADNQRLKDENGALIRVISKLSK
ncbi:hypothetical protein A6R68_17176 [Neotoma lepida]|uniref:cGMP-dependent protein kinase interacting domain-containing protein n=1 Tax=Neotoma lepida TaxID=56216 RepID=A0A1A6HCS5_NEOLE|nr:hypothetical protein A6R68_17176 [Neotoma lepida]